MYDNYNYPAGADNESAPWNQTEKEPAERDVEFTCTMRREDVTQITEYIPGGTYEEWDGDMSVTIHDDDDFTDTDFVKEWKGCHLTPERLIATLRDIAYAFADDDIPQKSRNHWLAIARECEGWVQEDEDAEMV